MRRYILVLLCLGTLLVSCNPRNFGHKKLLSIERYYLQNRVERFYLEHQRPPTAKEVDFNNSALPYDYWFISDYDKGQEGSFVVLLIDRLTLEQWVVYRGETKKSVQ